MPANKRLPLPRSINPAASLPSTNDARPSAPSSVAIATSSNASSALRHFRAVVTGFDKHSENDLALVKLASAKTWLCSTGR
ncbi:hypothetical protein E5176_01065 [Ensifer adhaerens]|nr:hypothetical protein E5176_01065 [Ensifer adhaerens]